MKQWKNKNIGLMYYIGFFIGIIGMLLSVFKDKLFMLFFIPSLILMFPKFLQLWKKDDKDISEGNMFVGTIVMFFVYLVMFGSIIYKFFITDGNIWRIIMLFDKS